MIDLEDELRAILTEDAMRAPAPADAPPDIRRRVRRRQARTMVGMFSTAAGAVVILATVLLVGRTLQGPADRVIPGGTLHNTEAASFSPGSPNWVVTIAEGNTSEGHWSFGISSSDGSTALGYSTTSMDANIVFGYDENSLPDLSGIRLLYPLNSPAPPATSEGWPVFGLVSTSTQSVELLAADGTTTPVALYDLPGSYAGQAKAFVIPGQAGTTPAGTLIALDGQGNELGRAQIPEPSA